MGGGQGTVSIVTGVGWLWWLEDDTAVVTRKQTSIILWLISVFEVYIKSQ